MSTGYCSVDADHRIAWSEHGDPDGAPVVLVHGSPGSRLFVPPVPDGVRLITFDRPGYGGSAARPGRTVLDTAADLDAVMRAAELDRPAIVGWSGGCPFAVAAAFGLGPDRVRALALVSGPGPIDEVPGAWDLLGERRLPTATLARNGEPDRAARQIARTMEPFIENPVAFLGNGRGPDGEFLHDPVLRPMLEAQMIEALRPGADGIAEDLIAMWMPFGFALRDVSVPTHVFHGALDRDNGEDTKTYATLIPHATLTIWPDLAHFAMLRTFPEVLTAVLERSTEPR